MCKQMAAIMFDNIRFILTRNYFVLMIVMLLYSGFVVASDDRERSASVYNKVSLLDWLVNDSPTAKRIEDSNDDVSRQQLQRAREMWEQAVEHSERNEYDLAEVHISEGLKLMTRVSRKVKDEERIRQARIDLYLQVKEHVGMFITAFDRIAVEKDKEDIKSLLDRDKLDAVLSSAESMYTDGDLITANELMKQAADMVDNALSDARHNEVLLHELKFESPEEEYSYEVSRNDSYVILIDLSQKKSTISQAEITYVQNLINENAQLRAQAEELANKGDIEKGIAVLEKGTDKLSRALRISGASF